MNESRLFLTTHDLLLIGDEKAADGLIDFVEKGGKLRSVDPCMQAALAI